MNQALYRKYRSKKLSEIVGQDHITKTLENALKSGKISHAYLFTGPRGVGKTSIARILAHEINQLPYTDESTHLDIIEIDAASNRRIDEIRDLREKVHIAPTSAKYKVYIIDEVHMLTKEAFNALLKTLEEPPAHVVFILATTELHKLPETIISRTQRFTFKAIDETAAVKHLQVIAKQEGIDIDEDALKLLAAHGRGSFRDSISLLDQVGNSGTKITRANAEKLVGIAANEHISQLESAVTSGSPADIVAALDNLTADGIDPSQVAKQLAARIRENIINGNLSETANNLLADLLSVSSSPNPAGQLEVALFRANLSHNPLASKPTPVASAPKLVAPAPAKAKLSATSAPQPELEPETPSEPEPSAEPIEEPTVIRSGNPAEWWHEVLAHIKTINNTLYGVLRMAETSVDGEILQLKFGFGFHKKKVDDASTQAKIRDAVKKVTGQSYRIESVIDKSLSGSSGPRQQATPAPATAEQAPVASDLSSIKNIFGGGEVLEA